MLHVMLLVKKVEIYFPKSSSNGFEMDQFDCYMVIYFMLLFVSSTFLCMQGKGNAACSLLIRGKFIFQK